MRLIDADILIEHMKRAYEKRIGKWDLVCTVAVIGAEDEKGDTHGHWMHIEEGRIKDCSNTPHLWKCSNCHTPFVALVDRYHYCPNCGAKMDEVEECGGQ